MDHEMPAAVVSDAWQYPGDSLHPWIPDLIERDRPVMAARPGVLRKLLPIRIDESGVFSGGCYLLDTQENAIAFQDWVTNDSFWTARTSSTATHFSKPMAICGRSPG